MNFHFLHKATNPLASQFKTECREVETLDRPQRPIPAVDCWLLQLTHRLDHWPFPTEAAPDVGPVATRAPS